MANREHLKILKQGVETWNKWRKKNFATQPDLTHAVLRRANLSEANLMGANLHRADLLGANLAAANLGEADLSASILVSANLPLANLSEANLQYADLIRTVFDSAHLAGTKFNRAILGSTIFAKVDLSKAKGLETVGHFGPSIISIDTLYFSKGRIPEIFLRGCGVPDDMIAFVRSIGASPIEFNSCFISYSTKDQDFATRLHADLQASGVRCWFAPHDIKGGKKLHEQIDWAIHYHDRTLLILSPDSINSAWVKTEIAKARKREVEEKRQILFPIRLVEFDVLKKWEYFDADSGTDYAKEIREYFIPDFSNWKDHDSYQKAFKDLLRDLKDERIKIAPVR